MNWQTDPNLARLEMERRARNGLVKSAVIWTPLFVIMGAALLYALISKLFFDGGATWFFIVVLAVLTFLFGYQGIHALLDLRNGEHTMRGEVTRRWSRTDSFVMRSHYIRVDGKHIFRIDRVFHDDVQPGDQVELRYYKRSAVVIECTRLKPEEQRGPENREELRRELGI